MMLRLMSVTAHHARMEEHVQIDSATTFVNARVVMTVRWST